MQQDASPHATVLLAISMLLEYTFVLHHSYGIFPAATTLQLTETSAGLN